jgi:hypothetical protein
VLVLPDVDATTAIRIAEEARARIARHPWSQLRPRDVQSGRAARRGTGVRSGNSSARTSCYTRPNGPDATWWPMATAKPSRSWNTVSNANPKIPPGEAAIFTG